MSDWFSIISTITAIVSIFLSNYLGRKATESQNKNAMLKERYMNFYVPIMKRMYTFNPKMFELGNLPGNMVFMDVVKTDVPEEFQDIAGKTESRQVNWVEEFIRENIQYATPDLLEIYYAHFRIREKSPEYDHWTTDLSERKNKMHEYDDLMFEHNRKLILQILEEAQLISATLELPNISKPLHDILK